jgi:hypothetical protein
VAALTMAAAEQQQNFNFMVDRFGWMKGFVFCFYDSKRKRR